MKLKMESAIRIYHFDCKYDGIQLTDGVFTHSPCMLGFCNHHHRQPKDSFT